MYWESDHINIKGELFLNSDLVRNFQDQLELLKNLHKQVVCDFFQFCVLLLMVLFCLDLDGGEH